MNKLLTATDYNDKIRQALKELIESKIITEKSSYDSTGIQLNWMDGDISGTTNVDKQGYEWLKITVLGTD